MVCRHKFCRTPLSLPFYLTPEWCLQTQCKNRNKLWTWFLQLFRIFDKLRPRNINCTSVSLPPSNTSYRRHNRNRIDEQRINTTSAEISSIARPTTTNAVSNKSSAKKNQTQKKNSAPDSDLLFFFRKFFSSENNEDDDEISRRS